MKGVAKGVVWFVLLPDMKNITLTKENEKKIINTLEKTSLLFSPNNYYGPVQYKVDFNTILKSVNNMNLYGVGMNR